MLVFRASRAVCRGPVDKVPEVEETKEESCEKLKRKKQELARLDREKGVSKPDSRRKSIGTTARIFKID